MKTESISQLVNHIIHKLEMFYSIFSFYLFWVPYLKC